MSGFNYSFATHYAQRVVGRGKLPVVHVRQTEIAQAGGHRFPAHFALCGVVSGPYVGGASVPNCRKCIAELRRIEKTGIEGRDCNATRRAGGRSHRAGQDLRSGGCTMMFMNEYEIEELAIAWRQHPIMGPAAHSLKNLMEWANANSDGWHSWPKPCRAAKQLQELLQGYVAEGADRCPECQAGGVSGYHRRYCSRPDVTRDAVRKAYKPIKAFRTRMTAAGMPWFTVEDV